MTPQLLSAFFRISLLFLFLTEAELPCSAQGKTVPDTVFISGDTIIANLDEVVITATRVKKKIIDIPYPVTRISFMNYTYDRKIGIDDMLTPLPGLFLQSRYGNHDVRFSIRGFGSRSNSGIRGVRILLDDIPESEPDGQTRIEAIDFNSIGRIEVVRGNSSSLYTNAPGGVANFFNDIEFNRSSVSLFSQSGSFGLWRSGLKAAVKTDKSRLLATYSYQNYDGYREHNNENWHILNLVYEVTPTANTNLKILGYFVDGLIKLPGSLTKEEFEADPFQAAQRSVDRDEKRITTKGRLGIRYTANMGRKLNHELEVTTYGTIKYFERTSKEYRIINRYGFGLTARYLYRSHFWNRTNEFSVGGDLFTQPARTEYYDNISGVKGDALNQLTNEDINNNGFYLSENFEILKRKMFILLTGRFDNVTYKLAEETLPSRSDRKQFNAFTPKLALNYKITPAIVLYTSFGLSFDSPANNEMDSFDPAYLYNQDLKPQESQNYELGIKGNLFRWDEDFFRKFIFEATGFYIVVNNEIIPYSVYGDVFYRNAARTNRLGTEMGVQLEIFRNLDFTASYTWSHFRYGSYFSGTVVQDSTGNIVETDKDFSGNIVPSVPEHNIYLALSYSHPFAKYFNVFARLSYMGISGLWVDDENSDKTKGYNLMNTVLGFDFRFRHFSVMLSGGINNILDITYVGFTNTNSADLRFYEPGAPRDCYISLNFGYVF